MVTQINAILTRIDRKSHVSDKYMDDNSSIDNKWTGEVGIYVGPVKEKSLFSGNEKNIIKELKITIPFFQGIEILTDDIITYDYIDKEHKISVTDAQLSGIGVTALPVWTVKTNVE